MLLDTNFLILDEPTNHLDLKTKDIFQNALINYHGTVAIVSHDRYFLDHLVNKVFELKDGSISDYFGNYSYFIEKRGQTDLPQKENVNTSEQNSRESAFKTKEQKRQEAEERNKLAKIKNACKKELTAVEQKIELLEAKKMQHETVLCDPQTHRGAVKIKAINIELKNITAELELSYNTWTELNSKLEQLAETNADESSVS
jgi:ATP-binding cassette subfamily F protein 3